MTAPRITLLASQERRLIDYFTSHPERHEQAAVLLFRRLRRPVEGLPQSDRYVAVDVIPFESNWVTDSSPSHVGFELRHLRELFRRCEEQGLVFGFAHNHPDDTPEFSTIDDKNELTLIEALSNRNGRNVHFVSLLWTKATWRARVRFAGDDPSSAMQARHVSVLGSGLNLHGCAVAGGEGEGITARQAAAFGKPFVDKLRSLRVGVVGGGGTGSPTVTLLARAGVGEIISIDKDHVDITNLNRVRGAGIDDVGKNKAQALRDFIASLKLPTRVVAIESLVDQDPAAVDALASCDVIFGCTDDQIGRELLTAATYIYGLVYIDMGLGGQVVQGDDGNHCLRYHYGRISTMLPEYGECLFCQGIISDAWIQHGYALRENPHLSEQEANERYLQGGGEAAPGVGPFTSAVADFAIATLFDLIQPFRRFPPELRRDFFTIDFVKMAFRSREASRNAACPYCKDGTYLLAPERYRLNRPSLGKAHVAL